MGKKIVNDTAESSLTSTEYAGNYIYENSNLQFFNTVEGYIEPVISTSGEILSFNYVFQYKDHLGNVRLTYSDADGNGSVDSSEIIKESHFYPFGMRHQGYNNVIISTNVGQQFTFNGQQFDESLSLNVQEMTFRQYDPAIGRFNGIDRLAALVPSITPYRFAYNNPVFWSDPTGLIEENVLMDMFNRSGSGRTTWQNDGHSGFYTDDGGYVGYTSDDTAFNTSPGSSTALPEVTVTLGNQESYQNTANQIEQNIYKTRWYSQPSSDAVQYANIGVGITSSAVVYRGAYWRSNELYNIQKNGKVVTRWSKTANGQSYWNNNFAKQARLNQVNKVKGIRAVGNKLGVVAGALTVYDVIDTGQVKPSHVINSIMIGASFTGFGAVVSGIYFVADFGTYLFTGKGIGDRLDEHYGPVYDFRE
ncbi:RHS repeat-associated core domain-containing protein [Flavobacteriaceae bacterium M23B6Z8]